VQVLSHIGGPEIAGVRVEGNSPGIAEAERVDLPPPFLLSDEGVLRRDEVRPVVVFRGIDVQSQDLSLEEKGVLRHPHRIITQSIVADGKIQHPVRPEGHAARVVIGELMRDLEEDTLARRIRRKGALGHLHLRQHIAPGIRLGIGEENAAIFRKIGMENDRMQPRLEVELLLQRRTQIEKHGRTRAFAISQQHVDQPALECDNTPGRILARLGDTHRAVRISEGGENGFQLEAILRRGTQNREYENGGKEKADTHKKAWMAQSRISPPVPPAMALSGKFRHQSPFRAG